MSQWAGGVLTAAGRALQAKVEAGTTLVLTKIKLGDGTEQMSAVDSLTDLVGPKAILGISSATSEDDVATITGVMSATQLTAGFYCREWGLFADDPDVGEILYMITIDAQPEWLPASTEAAQVSATYAMNIAVANATNIEVNIDPAGLVDVDMLNKLMGVAGRSKAYNVGDLASMPGLPAEHYLRCITAGTTGANTPVLPANIKDGDKISDGTVMWQVTKAISAAELGYRQPSTDYTERQIAYHSALPTGYYLECTTAGTTSAGEITPSSTIGGTVTDGTVTWTVNAQQNTLHQTWGEYHDFNQLTQEGFYYLAGPDNAPVSDTNGRWMCIVSAGRNSVGALTNYCTQLAIQANTANLPFTIWARAKQGSGWSAWQQQEAIVAKAFYWSGGYIKYASGLIIQWGVTAGETQGTVTFPISFNASPVVTFTSGGGAVYAGLSSVSATQFSFNSMTGSSSSKYYIAIGY